VRLVLQLFHGCEIRLDGLEKGHAMLQAALERNLGNEIESRIINQIVEKLVIEKAQKVCSICSMCLYLIWFVCSFVCLFVFVEVILC
jgi:hypothetical protein